MVMARLSAGVMELLRHTCTLADQSRKHTDRLQNDAARYRKGSGETQKRGVPPKVVGANLVCTTAKPRLTPTPECP